MSDFSLQDASSFSQAQLMNQVQILTAKKSLEVAEKQGEAVIQLLEVAVDLARDQGETSPKRGIDLKA